MKRILISIAFVLVLSVSATAQGLYKLQYRDVNNVVYDALIGWYGPGQMSTMRIKYRDANARTEFLVEQNLAFMQQPNGFKLQGFNARFVYPTQPPTTYSPDSFIFFVCTNGMFPCITTIDDQGLVGYLSEFREVSQLEAQGLLENFSFITPRTNPPVPAPGTNSRVTMHLIVVADTNADDIGIGVQIDTNAILNDFKRIANELGIGFTQRLVSGDAFKRDAVLSAVNELRPGQGDIVVFVYTGHGYRLATDNDPYPRFKLAYGTNVSASEVFNILKQKGAKLNITLVDTCNDRMNRTKFEYRYGYYLKTAAPGASRSALAKLFLNTPANIIVAAAGQGQLAGTDDVEGGIFMRTFLNTLKAETSATNNMIPSWTGIITKTRDLAYSTSLRKQHAVYYVE